MVRKSFLVKMLKDKLGIDYSNFDIHYSLIPLDIIFNSPDIDKRDVQFYLKKRKKHKSAIYSFTNDIPYQIYINDGDRKSSMYRFVVYHEIGHLVDFLYNCSNNLKERYYKKYNNTDNAEFFADCVSHYLLGHPLDRYQSVAIDILKRNIKHEKRKS